MEGLEEVALKLRLWGRGTVNGAQAGEGGR